MTQRIRDGSSVQNIVSCRTPVHYMDIYIKCRVDYNCTKNGPQNNLFDFYQVGGTGREMHAHVADKPL